MPRIDAISLCRLPTLHHALRLGPRMTSIGSAKPAGLMTRGEQPRDVLRVHDLRVVFRRVAEPVARRVQ